MNAKYITISLDITLEYEYFRTQVPLAQIREPFSAVRFVAERFDLSRMYVVSNIIRTIFDIYHSSNGND